MATVQSIIIAALRKLAVASEDETPSDAMLANGLEAYNNMLSAWVLSGVDLEHTDQALTDTFPIGDEFREGTIYSLFSENAVDDAETGTARVVSASPMTRSHKTPLEMRSASLIARPLVDAARVQCSRGVVLRSRGPIV